MRGKGKAVLYLLTLLSTPFVNLLSVNLFLESMPLTFGGILLYLSLELFGLAYAFPLALILALQANYFYLDPVWGAFILLEFLTVSLLRLKLGLNLVVSAWIFWVLLGIPFYFLVLNRLLELEAFLSLTVPLKSAVNSLVNVTSANLIAVVYSLYSKEQDRRVSYRQVVYLSLLIMATFPLLGWAIYNAKQEEEEMISEVREDLELITENVKKSLSYWLETHLSAVRELANRLVIWGPENREQLQWETEAIRRTFSDFHTCYIADAEATALAFYPEVSPSGRYLIGASLGSRPYYERVKSTMKAAVTGVFTDRFSIGPVVGITVPAVKEGRFVGYAYCSLSLEHVEDVVSKSSLKEGVYITVVDSQGRVIVSDFEDLKPLYSFYPGEVITVKRGVPIVSREKGLQPLRVGSYLHSYFFRRDSVGEDTGWKVATFISVRPYMVELFGYLSSNFIAIMLLSALSFLIAKMLGGVISNPLERFVRTIDAFSRLVDRGSRVNLPKANLLELSLLSDAFNELTGKLFSYMDELRRLAYYDTLTSLPNRTLLRDRIDVAIARAHRSGSKVAVLFIDLDYFKTVNDTLGHEAGDRVLVQVAHRLSSVFREVDTVARFGGDEFVAVVSDVKEITDVITVAEKVLRLFETPFEVEGEEVYLSASIGIAMYPDNGKDPSTLIKNADIAMYKAKEEGKNSFAFFSGEMDREAEEILTLKTKLHRALSRGEFSLYYQPIYRIETGEIVGLEALLRWTDPERGSIPPKRFIHLLEEVGFVREVGRWVMERAFSKSKEWERFGVYVSVNVSPRQFIDRRFVDKVIEVLKETDADPFNLVFEITETSLMYDPDESTKRLKKLKTLGFRFAVDDFGTGYSSLSYLKKLPIDIIKIDMSFTKNIEQSKVDRAIVSSVITLAKSLKLETLAEGVETKSQMEAMRELGCDLIQGFFSGRPLSEEEAEELLRKEKGL